MLETSFSEIFPIGAKVRCENEMWPGHWDRGVVGGHRRNACGVSQWIKIKLHDDELDCEYFVEFDYRYLDVDPHNSLVRLVKECK